MGIYNPSIRYPFFEIKIPQNCIFFNRKPTRTQCSETSFVATHGNQFYLLFTAKSVSFVVASTREEYK